MRLTRAAGGHACRGGGSPAHRARAGRRVADQTRRLRTPGGAQRAGAGSESNPTAGSPSSTPATRTSICPRMAHAVRWRRSSRPSPATARRPERLPRRQLHPQPSGQSVAGAGASSRSAPGRIPDCRAVSSMPAIRCFGSPRPARPPTTTRPAAHHLARTPRMPAAQRASSRHGSGSVRASSAHNVSAVRPRRRRPARRACRAPRRR